MKFLLLIKSIILVILLSSVLHGCQEKEIKNCENLETLDGITRVNGNRYTGTCNIVMGTTLSRTISYKRGYLVKEIAYYPSGNIQYIGNRKKGQIHGDFISYYDNKVISIEGSLIKGQYDGEWKYYDDDGSLNKTLIWKNGEQIDSIAHK